MHQSIKAANNGSATLVPALLADCELPLLSRFRVPLDFRNQDREHWEAEADGGAGAVSVSGDSAVRAGGCSSLPCALDFRNQDREPWEAEAEMLRKKLAAPVPMVAPVPCPYSGIRRVWFSS
jgi:hypothetical protein